MGEVEPKSYMVQDELIIRSKLEPRLYQQLLFISALKQNSLIVLPTGLGKTIIMILLAAYTVDKKGLRHSMICITTPTRPLVSQIANEFRKWLNIPGGSVIEITGTVPSKHREKLYTRAHVFIGTPQTFHNDIQKGILKPENIDLLCVDEAHRALGNHDYVKIARKMECHIVGFTATPGNNLNDALSVCYNLRLQKALVRTLESSDVRKFLTEHQPQEIYISLPEIYHDILNKLGKIKYNTAYQLQLSGYPIDPSRVTRFTISRLHKSLVKEKPGKNLIHTANLLRLFHLQEIIETQGLPQAKKTFKTWFNERPMNWSKRQFLSNPQVLDINDIISKNPVAHPKLHYLVDLLIKRDSDSKVIIFSNFRTSVYFLHKELSKFGLKTGIFIGHSGKKGMTNREQTEAINKFKRGYTPIILATSVGEEGIDVGDCDYVIFYDTVGSVVRYIQRMGRGRKKHSKIYHLVTKGTSDERKFYSGQYNRENIASFFSDGSFEIKLNKLWKELGWEPENFDGKGRTTQKVMNFFISGKKEAKKEKNAKSTLSLKIPIDLQHSREGRILESRGFLLTPFSTPEWLSPVELLIITANGTPIIWIPLSILPKLVIDEQLHRITERLEKTYVGIPIFIIEQGELPGFPRVKFARLQYNWQVEGRAIFITTSNIELALKIIENIAMKDTRTAFQVTTDVKMLAAIPKISYKRANSLIQHFGSLLKVLKATPEDFVQINGIGEKTAEYLWKALHQGEKSVINSVN